MHINVSGEQHTSSIKQLLKNISTNPESQKELSRWGLEISSQLLVVRLVSNFQIQLYNISCKESVSLQINAFEVHIL